MLRWLILAAAVFAAIWLLRRSLARREGEPPRAGRGSAPAELVSCAHCAVHLPRGEALEQAGNFYCSDEHRRLGPVR
jgi:uncharacterized protein